MNSPAGVVRSLIAKAVLRNMTDELSIIRLDQFLKLTGLVGTGGQAKLIIQAGEVLVNGEVETRRRKQLCPGDVVVWDGEEFEVSMGEPDESMGEAIDQPMDESVGESINTQTDDDAQELTGEA